MWSVITTRIHFGDFEIAPGEKLRKAKHDAFVIQRYGIDQVGGAIFLGARRAIADRDRQVIMYVRT